jgi:geranylgeranyl pyrophosphate synthase
MTLPAPAAVPISPLLQAIYLSAPTGVPPAVWQRALVEPAVEFLQRPGKALRAGLVELGALLAGGAPPATIDAVATAIELLHAGSLIVDDVEDGARERRGAPALHHLVGTPLAINTGNWMYFRALIALDEIGLDPGALRVALHGLHACHLGQALDLGASLASAPPGDVPAIVAATSRLKTGALTGMAAQLGAIAAAAPPGVEEEVRALGEAVGVGLQMLDDLGGVIAPARADKGAEDLRTGRLTWPWAWFAEIAEPSRFTRLAQRARIDVGGVAAVLADEIGEIGRRAVRTQLDGALDAATAALGDGPAMLAVRAHLAAMEVAYV